MFCSGSRFENVRAGPASYVVFGARKLTSKRSRSGNAVRSDPWRRFGRSSTPTQFFLAHIFDLLLVGKSANCLFLRSYGFLDVIGRCASKNDPRSFDFQLSTTFGRGVKEMISSGRHDFWQGETLPSNCWVLILPFQGLLFI